MMRDAVPRAPDAHIQSLRGVAVLMLVLFHVVGAESGLGVGVADDSGWRHAMQSMGYLRMPLFTAISGWVYSLRPVMPEAARGFLLGKARRLLFPMVSAGSLFWCLHQVYPLDGTPPPISEIWRLLVFQYIHFWYLQALFLVFITIGLLERARLLGSLPRWTIALAASLAFSYWGPHAEVFFSLKGYAYLLPYFLLGLGLQRFRNLLLRPGWVLTTLCLAVLLQLRFEVGYHIELGRLALGKRSAFGLLLSAAWVSAALGLHWSSPRLMAIGRHSFAIYLFHPLFYAGTTALLRAAGWTPETPAILAGLAAGVLGPIALDRRLPAGGLLRLLLLGERWRRGRPPAPAPPSGGLSELTTSVMTGSREATAGP